MKKKIDLTNPRETARIGPRQLKDPNSVEFAWQTISLLRTRYQSKVLREKDWRDILIEAERYRIFEKVPEGEPYGSLEAMLQAEIGVGVEESVAVVKARAEEAEVAEEAGEGLKPHGGNRKSEEEESSLQCKLETHGNSTDYLTARIARDHPAILERMKAGEFRSVRAAAREAGIVRDPTPLEVLRRAWNKASAEEREAIRKWIQDQA